MAQRQIDAVIANGENVAGDSGITRELAEELETGVSVITTGNHAWDKKEAVEYFSREPRLLRLGTFGSPEMAAWSSRRQVENGSPSFN